MTVCLCQLLTLPIQSASIATGGQLQLRCKARTDVLMAVGYDQGRPGVELCMVCLQTLQSAGSLGSRTNTTSVFSSALDSYPNVKTCASSSSTSSSGSASTETAGR